jgi:hypothetical protein
MARGRWNGGIIGPNLKVTTSSASGIFSLSEAQVDVSAGLLPQVPPPVIIPPDSQFNLTTLLLHGDGSTTNNNTFLDESTNAATITRNGTPTQGTFSPFSQTGWSAYFSGTSGAPDWISTASSSTYNVSSGNWTIEAWFYSTSTDVSNRYITFTPASGTVFGLIPAGGNYFAINQFGTTSPVTTSASTVKLNQWSHVAIVKNGSTTYVYIDGVLGGSGTVSWSNSAHTIYFGGNGGSYAYNYNGWISNARIVMGTALYSGSTYTVPTAPLTAITNTQFLTLNNNRFYDSSNGNAVLLGVTTGPTVQAFSPFPPAAAYGVSSVGGSAYFNGSADTLTVSGTGSFNIASATNFTIEAWVYPTSTGTSKAIVAKDWSPGTSYPSFGVILTTTNTIQFSVGSGTTSGTGSATYTSTGTAPVNSWTHVAVVVNGSNYSIYLNGVQDTTGSYGGTVGTSTNAMIVGGTNSGSLGVDYFGGYISNLRVTKSAVYTSAFTPPTSPVTAIANTQLLVNGTNAGIYDSTARNDVSTVGTCQISSSQSKYGGSSIYFATTGDGLTIPANSLLSTFSTGNFTIEFWMRYTTPGAVIADLIRSTTWAIVDYSNGSLYWQNAYASSSLLYYNHGSLADGNWHHVAIVRSATSTLTMYVDGTAIGSGTDSNTYNTNSAITIGINGSYGQFLGYMDDIRITKGYARYTSNFTPPTTTFPNQ